MAHACPQENTMIVEGSGQTTFAALNDCMFWLIEEGRNCWDPTAINFAFNEPAGCWICTMTVLQTSEEPTTLYDFEVDSELDEG
jgi:hypothetical protein